jgi:hypothetical protein
VISCFFVEIRPSLNNSLENHEWTRMNTKPAQEGSCAMATTRHCMEPILSGGKGNRSRDFICVHSCSFVVALHRYGHGGRHGINPCPSIEIAVSAHQPARGDTLVESLDAAPLGSPAPTDIFCFPPPRQRWILAEPPFANARTCSTVAMVVSPGNVVSNAPWAQPRLTASCGDSPVNKP